MLATDRNLFTVEVQNLVSLFSSSFEDWVLLSQVNVDITSIDSR